MYVSCNLYFNLFFTIPLTSLTTSQCFSAKVSLPVTSFTFAFFLFISRRDESVSHLVLTKHRFIPRRASTWKSSRYFRRACLMALNILQTSLPQRQGIYITLKHLYWDKSCFITFTTFNVHRTLRCHQRENFAKVSRRQFLRSVLQRESTIHFDQNICAVVLLFLVMSWEQPNTFCESF